VPLEGPPSCAGRKGCIRRPPFDSNLMWLQKGTLLSGLVLLVVQLSFEARPPSVEAIEGDGPLRVIETEVDWGALGPLVASAELEDGPRTVIVTLDLAAPGRYPPTILQDLEDNRWGGHPHGR
jgi:hypothetical protein